MQVFVAAGGEAPASPDTLWRARWPSAAEAEAAGASEYLFDGDVLSLTLCRAASQSEHHVTPEVRLRAAIRLAAQNRGKQFDQCQPPDQPALVKPGPVSVDMDIELLRHWLLQALERIGRAVWCLIWSHDAIVAPLGKI